MGSWLLVVALAGWSVPPARAIDIVWRNAISGLFQNSARWEPQQVPAATDRAIFAQAISYTVSFNASPTNEQALVDRGSLVWSLLGRSYTLTGKPGALFDLGLDVTGAGVPASLSVRGGQVSTVGARIDGVGGGSGAAIIESDGSLAVSGASLVVGDFGPGAVQVLAGGLLSSDFATLAFEETSTGAAIISGANARWLNNVGSTSHPLRVGSAGDALLSVNGGGRVATGQLIVADLVTSNSQVALSGVGSTIDAADGVFIGYEGHGNLQATGGAVLTSAYGELGSMTGSHGEAAVSGGGSRWNMAGTLNVGFQGAGTLGIDSGGRVASGLAILGQKAAGHGVVTVDGAASQWDLSQQLQVGQEGTGTLLVSGGGIVTSLKSTSSSGSSGILGAYATGQGMATISGAGSAWSGDGVLQIGFNGMGDLTIANGGRAAHDSVAIARNSGSQGEATLTGAGSRLEATAILSIGGSASASGGIGRLTVGSGGLSKAGSQVTVWTAGELRLAGGSVEAPLVNLAQGKLTGAGAVVGNLTNGGLVRADGTAAPLTVSGSYTQSAAATLEIVVGPSGGGRLDVAGHAHWDGALRVTSTSGYVPPSGSVFAAATFGSGSGSFDIVATAFGPEAQQFFALLASPGGLTLYAPLVGDANFDGMVSGGDYTIWADHFGQSGGWAQGDFNGDGLISGGDYTLWADHFGATISLGAPPPSVAVPEPETVGLGLAAAFTAAALAAARQRLASRRLRSSGRGLARRRPEAVRRVPA